MNNTMSASRLTFVLQSYIENFTCGTFHCSCKANKGDILYMSKHLVLPTRMLFGTLVNYFYAEDSVPRINLFLMF